MSLDRLRELEAQLQSLDTEPLEVFRVPSPPRSRVKPALARPKPAERIHGCSHIETRKSEIEEIHTGLNVQYDQLCEECAVLTAQLQLAERSRYALKGVIDGNELQNVIGLLEEIDRKTLGEIVSYSSPPQAVRNTIECVYLILNAHTFGETSKLVVNWICAQEMITKRTFIKKLLGFNTEMLLMSNAKLMRSVRQKIHFDGMHELNLSLESPSMTANQATSNQNDLKREDSASDFSSVSFASHPCGTLFRWCESQLRRAVLLPRLPMMEKEMMEHATIASEARVRLVHSQGLLKTVRDRLDRIERERAWVIELGPCMPPMDPASVSIFPQVEVVDLQDMAREQWKARRMAKEAARVSAIAKRDAMLSAAAAEATAAAAAAVATAAEGGGGGSTA
jgi:hypothetical protein